MTKSQKNGTCWSEKQLGEILTLNYGWSLPEKNRVAGGVPVFGSNGIVGTHNEPLVPSEGIIVGRKGSAGNVHLSRKPFCPIDTTFFITPSDTKLDLEFLFYLLLHVDLKRILGDVGVPGLNREMAYREKATFPDEVSEQRKIAGVLGLVQRAMEQQERLLARTAELKKALLHRLFTHGLRHEPQKQTEIGSLPESWEVVELASAVEQIDYGISAPIPKTPPENGVTIVSTADITKDGRMLYDQIRRITAPEKTIKRLTLQTGDVLFNWRNSAELIGKSAVFQEQDEPHVFASFILRIKCGEKKSHNFFLTHLMNHFRETQIFVKLARRAVNQANYNRNEISVLKIPLPSYEEQREIADAIAAVDGKIALHRRKHATLSGLFRTLLHELMTARLRVHHLALPELETATKD
jgi:type I restriction enzyme S subunit